MRSRRNAFAVGVEPRPLRRSRPGIHCPASACLTRNDLGKAASLPYCHSFGARRRPSPAQRGRGRQAQGGAVSGDAFPTGTSAPGRSDTLAAWSGTSRWRSPWPSAEGPTPRAYRQFPGPIFKARSGRRARVEGRLGEDPSRGESRHPLRARSTLDRANNPSSSARSPILSRMNGDFHAGDSCERGRSRAPLTASCGALASAPPMRT
jgi:hypothetical protein